MRSRAGFTLIEISIAVFIMLILLLLAVPSINGVLADRRLRRSLDDLNRLVGQAQKQSILERRSYLVSWQKEGLAVRPEGWQKDEERKPIATLKVRKGESFKLALPASLQDEPPPQWIFWPSGNCEPAVITYRGPNGGFRATYSALTERAAVDNYGAR